MVHFAKHIFDDMDGTEASCRLVNALFTQTVHGSSVFLMLTQICRLKMVTAKIPGECEWTSAKIVSIGMAFNLLDTVCIFLASPSGSNFYLACTNPGHSGQTSSEWGFLPEFGFLFIALKAMTIVHHAVGIGAISMAAIWLRRQERIVGTHSQVRRLRNVNYTRSTDSIGK